MPMNPRLLVPRASFDADAAAYIRAVESADTQALEAGVKRAIDNFVRGCKSDGIWTAIKASCILAGARTLAGALVPLVGTAPTNNGPFVSGDYDRKTGLLGNGTTKGLNSNRNENADGQNDNHYAVWAHTLGTGLAIANFGTNSTTMSQAATRNRSFSADLFTAVAGFYGISRSASASYVRRNGGADTTLTRASGAESANAVGVFYNNSGTFGSHRLAFYSMGSALNLSQLDARLSTLITAIGNAIP